MKSHIVGTPAKDGPMTRKEREGRNAIRKVIKKRLKERPLSNYERSKN